MTGSNEGGLSRQDIVLVDFIFSEDTGSKRRPVLVLSSAEYHHGRQEAVVAAIHLLVARNAAGPDFCRAIQRRFDDCAAFSIGKRRRLAGADRLDGRAHALAAAASRSRWARLFFSAAVFSWPQAAPISRPRGVRTGALMPPSKTMSEKARMRSGREVS